MPTSGDRRPGRRGASAASVLVLALALLAGCGALPASDRATGTPTASAEGDAVRVVDVVDGDTIKVAYPDGTEETVRLLGVDTPEVYTKNQPGEFEGVPETEAGRACLRTWGERASAFATEALAGRDVRLVFDPESDRRGSFGRLLAYVHVDGDRSFNRRLLEEGYARVYDSRFTRRDAFEAAEASARSAGRGLWTCANAATTTAGAPPNATLSVVEVHADAAGNDNENPNDEYVVLRNDGDETVDLTGWTLSDDDGHRYRFPDGFALAPNATVTLHTGRGEDTDAALHWGARSAYWNNDGDVVIVRTPSGGVALRYAY